MKKWIISLVVLALLGGTAYFIYSRVQADEARKEAEKPKLVAQAQKRTIVSTVEATGFVQPIQVTDVKAELTGPGRILKIHVANNQVVKVGQLIVELDPILILPQKEEAESSYRSQTLALEKAKRDYERQVQLRAKNYTTEKDFEDAKTAYEIAKLDLDVMRARMEEANEAYKRTFIRAPHDGIVSDLNVTEGQVIVGAGSVSGGTTIMKINDVSKMYVDTDVNEIDINRIHMDGKASIAFDSLPDARFDGTITEISGTAVNRNALRVFPVKIVFDVAGQRVYPGISAAVSIPVTQVQDAVSVIISAVFSDGPKRFVVVQNADGKLHKRYVLTGISDASYVQVKDGLKDGEMVSLVRPNSLEEIVVQNAAPKSAR